MTGRAPTFLAALAATMLGAASPAAQAPPRDSSTAAAPAAGNGRLRGRVVDAASAMPVRRAQITISGDRGVQRLVTTDGNGRYEVTGLPAGHFTIVVSKGGYLTLQYGQRRPFEPGRPVSLAAGQTSTGLDLALPRAGAISGRITDRFGEPVVGAEIQVERYQYATDGQRRLSRAPGSAVTTNDLGEFRWFGLMPGEYMVSANLRQPPIPPSVSGGSTTAVGYVQTYNGGTASAANAQPVVLGVGEEASVQFGLAQGRLSHISGTVTDSTGRPAASAEIMLTTRAENGRATGRGGASTAPDGTFAIPNVPPGDHFVQIRLSRRADGNIGTEHANVPVATDGQNVDGLQIVTAPPSTLTGVVRWEGTAPRTSPALQIAAKSVDRRPSLLGIAGVNEPGTDGRVQADDTFQLGGVAGVVRLTATGVPPDWMVKSISAGPVDLMTTGAEAAAISGAVEVVLTDRQGRVTGTVRDANGGAAADSLIVLLPAVAMDAEIAQPYTRTLRSDARGAFELRGLPPGSYVAAAFEALEQGYEWDPAFQSFVRQSVRPFTIGEGQGITLELALLR